MATLEGLRVLVVEDEVMIAMMLEDMLADAGCVVVGSVPRVAAAVRAVRAEPLDLALLDVNLAGEKVFPVAEALAERGVPFIFLTGYGRGGLPPEHASRPALVKPFRSQALLGAITTLFLHHDEGQLS